MYTEFMIDCSIKPDAPESVMAALHLLVNDRDLAGYEKATPEPFVIESARTPEGKAFFSDHRHTWIGNPVDYLRVASKSPEWAFDGQHLRVGTEVKNYDEVIQKFWAWVSPWIAEPEGTHIGACACMRRPITKALWWSAKRFRRARMTTTTKTCTLKSPAQPCPWRVDKDARSGESRMTVSELTHARRMAMM